MFKCIFILLFGINLSFAKITDVEYASMPVLFEMGDFDRCLMFEEKALYCSITFQLKPENPEKPSKNWRIIEDVISDENNYRHDQLRHGVCIPITCPEIPLEIYNNQTELKRSLTECYNRKYSDQGLIGEIIKMECETQEPPNPIDTIDYTVAIVLIGYITFVIVASFVEGIARYRDNYEEVMKKTHMKIFGIFSITKNWERLKYVDHTNPDIEKLKCIQGIRFYNMTLVILAHSIMISLAAPVLNITFTENIRDHPTFIFLSNGGYVVETFFLISTWLLTWQLMTVYEKKKNVKITDLLSVFVNRYIRLTPLLALMIALHSTWLNHWYRGPIWNMFISREYNNCRANWWKNLLYIQIYSDNKNMCMAHTWYMSVDTQLFALSLIAIYFMNKYPKLIPYIIALPLMLHIAILGYYNYTNDWEYILRQTPETIYKINFLKIEQWIAQSITVYSNLPGMGVGLFYGYIYYKYRNYNLFPTKFHVLLWWIITFGCSFGIILFPGLIYFSRSYVPNMMFSLVVGCVARILFVIGIGYGILGFSQKIGWMALWAVEWSPTYVLGRLTYSAYIAHIFIVGFRGALIRGPMYITIPKCVQDFASDAALSYLLAVILMLCFELPLSELQKLWVGNIKKESIRQDDKKD